MVFSNIATLFLGLFLFADNFDQVSSGKLGGISMLLRPFQPKLDMRTAIGAMVRQYVESLDTIFAKYQCMEKGTKNVVGTQNEMEAVEENEINKICQTALFVDKEFRFILSPQAENAAIERAVNSLTVPIQNLAVLAKNKLLGEIPTEQAEKIDGIVRKMFESKNAYKKFKENVTKIFAEISKTEKNCNEIPGSVIYELMRNIEAMEANAQAAADVAAAVDVEMCQSSAQCQGVVCPLEASENGNKKKANNSSSSKTVKQMQQKLTIAMQKFAASIYAFEVLVDAKNASAEGVQLAQQQAGSSKQQSRHRVKRCGPEMGLILEDICCCCCK